MEIKADAPVPVPVPAPVRTKKYQCTNCTFETDTKKSLSNHNDKRKNKCNRKINSTCKYCSKEFINKNSLYLHVKKHCHIKKFKDKEAANEIKEIEQQTLNQNQKIIISNDNMASIVQNNNVGDVHIGDKFVNITNNYYILPFGKEDITFITKADIIVLLDAKIKCIEEYIKLVHLNPDHKHNYNITAVDVTFNMVNEWDGTKWLFKQPEQVNIAIFKKVFNLIETTSQQFGLKIPVEIINYHKTMCEYEEACNSFDEIDPKNERKIMKQIKSLMTILYNKKEEVASEHEKMKKTTVTPPIKKEPSKMSVNKFIPEPTRHSYIDSSADDNDYS
jgi:hypothetical protein